MPSHTLTGFARPSFRQIEARSSRAYGRGVLRETIGENLRQTVERHAEREALVVRHQGYRATYRELWKQIDLAARALIAHGVEKGDRLGLWAGSRHERVVLQFAAARAGAILVTIDPACSASDLAYALADSGVSVLVTDRGRSHARPGLRETIVLDDDWREFLGHAELVDRWELAEREASLQFDDPIAIEYAVRALGAPRATTRSHLAILSSAQAVAQARGCDEGDRVCVPVSLSQALGLVAGVQACASSGACIVLPSEQFDPGAVLEAVEAERCTALLGTSRMFAEELAHPGFERFDLTALRAALIGGGQCPAAVIKSLRATMGIKEVALFV